MPNILIWLPKGENKAGHVTLSTDKFHISFWPSRFLKDGIATLVDGLNFLSGVEGCLVLNKKVDRVYEDSDPEEYEISASLTNEDINSVYEEFLRFNGINPEDVTLERGEDLFQMEKPELSQKLVGQTKYSFSVELVSRKESASSTSFYYKQQSCVSLIFNLIQTAWLKKNPDRPVPFSIPDAIMMTRDFEYRQFSFQVPWFKEVVISYLVPGDVNEPFRDRTPLFTLSELGPDLIIFFVFLFLLVLLCYSFPVLRYPVVFVIFGLICDGPPLSIENVCLHLFLMSLVYIFSLGLLLLITIMWYLYVILFYINYMFRKPPLELSRILLSPGHELFEMFVPKMGKLRKIIELKVRGIERVL